MKNNFIQNSVPDWIDILCIILHLLLHFTYIYFIILFLFYFIIFFVQLDIFLYFFHIKKTFILEFACYFI